MELLLKCVYYICLYFRPVTFIIASIIIDLFYCIIFFWRQKKRLLVSLEFGGEMGPLDEFISN